MQVNLGQNCMRQAYYPRHKFLGQAQANPKAKRTHLAAAHDRETQPISKATRHRSEATPSRQIRRVHEDPRAHQSSKTDSRQALTHIHGMGGPPSSLLTKDRGKLGQPKAGRPTKSPDLVVATHGPHCLSDDTWRGVVGPQWRFGSISGQGAGGSLL